MMGVTSCSSLFTAAYFFGVTVYFKTFWKPWRFTKAKSDIILILVWKWCLSFVVEDDDHDIYSSLLFGCCGVPGGDWWVQSGCGIPFYRLGRSGCMLSYEYLIKSVCHIYNPGANYLHVNMHNKKVLSVLKSW